MCNKTKQINRGSCAGVFVWLEREKQQSFLCNSRKQIFIQLFWLRSSPALFVSMARRSNNASPEELIKVLSLLQKKPPQSTFYSMTTEQQIAEKEDLLTEMILLSARPTNSWASNSWVSCFENGVAEI